MQKLLEEYYKKQKRIRNLEEIIGEQIKKSHKDLENLINIEIEELELEI